MLAKLLSLGTDEQGQGITEYSLVLGVIAVGVVGIVFGIKMGVYNLYDKTILRIKQAARDAGLLD